MVVGKIITKLIQSVPTWEVTKYYGRVCIFQLKCLKYRMQTSEAWFNFKCKFMPGSLRDDAECEEHEQPQQKQPDNQAVKCYKLEPSKKCASQTKVKAPPCKAQPAAKPQPQQQAVAKQKPCPKQKPKASKCKQPQQSQKPPAQSQGGCKFQGCNTQSKECKFEGCKTTKARSKKKQKKCS